MLIKRKPPKSESIDVKNKLETYRNSRDAAGMFCRILKAVREQTAENQKKREEARKKRDGNSHVS